MQRTSTGGISKRAISVLVIGSALSSLFVGSIVYYRIVRSVWREFPKFPKWLQMKLKRGQPQRGVAQEETDYNSVLGCPNNQCLKVLMRIEKVNGDPLPESLMNPQQLNVFCVQYAGEQPYHVELLSSYEACISYREGVVIAVVAGRLMNTTAWNEIPLVVSCTLVPRERMSAIVKAHKNIRGTWEGNEQK